MTTIINIQELYKLIPETKSLEGVNFTNLRQLLTSVIEKVEQSGVYEFVQYIQGSPSLFVVREKPVRSDNRLTNENIAYYQSEPEVTFETTKKGKTKVKISEPTPEPQKVIPDYEEIEPENSKLFQETKLPWS